MHGRPGGSMGPELLMRVCLDEMDSIFICRICVPIPDFFFSDINTMSSCSICSCFPPHPNFHGGNHQVESETYPSPNCFPGVVTVGYASVAGDTGGSGSSAAQNASAVLFGVTLTLLGQVVQAAQAQIMFLW